MPIHKSYNETAIQRARSELRPFQSNVIVQTANGSELRAVWDGCRFVDFDLGDPLDAQDFWIDSKIPEGGFNAGQYGMKL